MERTYVIPRADSEIGRVLVKSLYPNGQVFGLVSSRDALEQMRDKTNPAFEAVVWNQKTLVGIKNALLTLQTRFKGSYEFIVLLEKVEDGEPFHEMRTGVLYDRIDGIFKSTVLLIREIISCLEKQLKGTLTIVYRVDKNANHNALNTLFWGGMRGFINRLISVNKKKDFHIIGIETQSDNPDEIARFVNKILIDKRSKLASRYWYFQSGLLSSLKK